MILNTNMKCKYLKDLGKGILTLHIKISADFLVLTNSVKSKVDVTL